MAEDVIHTAIWVPDLEQTLSFYETLGLTESHRFTRGGTENVYLGGDHGEIQFKYDGSDRTVSPDRSDLDHIALAVDDVDAEFERVVSETDCPVVEEPMTVDAAGARVAFVEDPNGYVVELVESL
jgi:lactoylglutathione lyase